MQNGKVSYLLPNEAPKVGINVSSDVELKKTVARAKMNGDEPVRDANGVIETVESDVPSCRATTCSKVNLKAKGPGGCLGHECCRRSAFWCGVRVLRDACLPGWCDELRARAGLCDR